MNKDFYWKLADDYMEALKKLPPIFYILERDSMASGLALITAACKQELGREVAYDLTEYITAKLDESSKALMTK